MTLFELIITLYCFITLPCIFAIITILAVNRIHTDDTHLPIGKWLISNPVGVIILPVGVILIFTFGLTNYSLTDFTKSYISGNILLAAFITTVFGISNYLFEKQQKENKMNIVEQVTKNTQKIIDDFKAEQQQQRKEDQVRFEQQRKEDQQQRLQEQQRFEAFVSQLGYDVKELMKDKHIREGREQITDQ